GLGLSPVPPGTVILAEIYPSLVDPAVRAANEAIKDRAQVHLLATAFAALDRTGELGPLFSLDAEGLTGAETQRVVEEEGWILGAGFETKLVEALQPMR
ncbi:MAG: hypothetical protein AAFU72_17255, partial [Pseudomonadota bacterium]